MIDDIEYRMVCDENDNLKAENMALREVLIDIAERGCELKVPDGEDEHELCSTSAMTLEQAYMLGLTFEEWSLGMSVDEAEFWKRYGRQDRHKLASD